MNYNFVKKDIRVENYSLIYCIGFCYVCFK